MPDKTPLSNKKKILFWSITILFPVLLFSLIEFGLRLGAYNEELQDLFIELPNKPKYYVANPAFAKRYFPAFTPEVAPAPFLKEKPENTFRVFVFGGSSTQGFPFSFYGSFASRMEQKLMMETKGLHVEVINLGMTAVNSYVIWDLSKRVLPYDPDAVVIYAGHNEFYGSFGVGSTQFGIGRQIWLKRFLIKLKNLRIYQVIENMLKPEAENSNNRTLMARVVKESEILLGDEIYRAGIEQFRTNLTDIVETFSENDIPVYIGSITSNLKDQPPLGESSEALAAYNNAQGFYERGEIVKAIEKYIEAKDKDEIRFRAPEEMNTVIKQVANEDHVILVDINQVSYDSSDSGIPDRSFFADHLHPVWNANQLIGEMFFDSIIENQLGEYYLPNKLSRRPHLSEFDKTFSETPVARLTSGYPFIKGLTRGEEQQNFQNRLNYYLSNSYVDSIAASAWRTQRQAYLALIDIINYQFNQQDEVGISEHYLSLAQWQVFNDKLLKKGIDRSVQNRSLDSNTALLLHLILNKEERSDPYYANALSAIYLLNNELEHAEVWLQKSEQLDPNSKELLYNYARFHVLDGDTLKAKTYYDRYMSLSQQN